MNYARGRRQKPSHHSTVDYFYGNQVDVPRVRSVYQSTLLDMVILKFWETQSKPQIVSGLGIHTSQSLLENLEFERARVDRLCDGPNTLDGSKKTQKQACKTLMQELLVMV
jgi:hypothetical protein